MPRRNGCYAILLELRKNSKNICEARSLITCKITRYMHDIQFFCAFGFCGLHVSLALILWEWWRLFVMRELLQYKIHLELCVQCVILVWICEWLVVKFLSRGGVDKHRLFVCFLRGERSRRHLLLHLLLGLGGDNFAFLGADFRDKHRVNIR